MNSNPKLFPPKLPLFYQVKRSLGGGPAIDVAASIDSEWDRLQMDEVQIFKLGRETNCKPRIALGVGSRGIARLPVMVKKIVDRIKQAGGEPFIVPAMGSHGGATAEGQREVLKSLGITDVTMGCSLEATMDTVLIGNTEDGLPAYLDAIAAKADGIMLINRIKMHTSFHGALESGLHKMLAIGLGKEKAATLLHARGPDGLRDDMPKVAKFLLTQVPFLAGFGVVEDGSHHSVLLRAFTPQDIERGEQELLKYSKSLAPTLPFIAFDILVVDQMGKDISGTGMDTNIIGRLRIQGKPEPTSPKIKAIVVLDLTEGTHGNALGMGLADFTTQTLADKVDMPLTQKNVMASGFLERGKLPTVLPNAHEALQAAMDFIKEKFDAEKNQNELRILRLHNTLELETFWVSENLIEEARGLAGYLEDSGPFAFME